ncbi:MAG: hypothetical protein JWO94_2613 [Verrucomicrobiaceae bacterium]|nr:hypothetical protein [Verrucomicrobiaceae bacterium]
MHSPGPPPQDPYRPEGTTPPQEPWRSPWSDEEVSPPPRASGEPSYRNPIAAAWIDNSPVIQELNASFARQRRQQMNLLLVLSVTVFSFTVLAWVYVRDDDPPWDGDLVSEKVAVSSTACEAPDRLHLALDAAKPTDSPDLAIRSPALWDTPALSRVVLANATAFSHIKDLLSDDDWQPQNPAWKAVDLGSHEQWHSLGVAKEAAAAYYSRRGQDEAAMLAGMELAVMAEKLQSISAWPTYYARGVEMHERACKAIASTLRQASIDARRLSQIQAEFERLAPDEGVLKARLAGFYEFERHLIVGSRPGDPWDEPAAHLTKKHSSRLFFKPNQTLALFASSMRELSDQAAKPPIAISHQITQRLGPPGRPSGFPGGPNRSGLKYANDRLWNYANLLDYLALQRTRHALVLTLFGVRRYVLDHGKAPDKLEDLLPHYFTALPADPYTGEPLRYDAAKGLIYSVGIDFRSEGGRANDDPMSDDAEPTVMIR